MGVRYMTNHTGRRSWPCWTHKLKGNGIYLFDEPEAALSPSRQLVALRAINQLVEGSSQFIIATHSPILLSYPKAKIVLFGQARVSAKLRMKILSITL